MKIIGLSGSLRSDSFNTRLLREAAQLLPAGAELEVYEDLGSIPPYSEDDELAPSEAVEALRAALRGADGLLLATPEYNSSLPGQLKNALDWASRPVGESAVLGTPALVIGASRGMFGAVWAQAEGRKVLGAMGARVIDRELPVSKAHERLEDDGRLLDFELARELREGLNEMVAEIEREAEARVAA
jgi:chromate reductase, NAD(P)H dehydrogenase (quinone)